MENSDMPALPCRPIDTLEGEMETGGGRYVTSNGITKREYLAAKFMQSLLHTREWQSLRAVAVDALRATDALLEELEK